MESSSRNVELARRSQAPGGMLSIATAAALLGRSKSTVYRMVRRNRIRHVREGRRVFIEATALDPMVRTDQAKPTPDAPESPAPSAVVGTGQGQRELTIPPRFGPSVVFIVC
jgi:excisionase family DNA binding protein